jgi:hypothetical protein
MRQLAFGILLTTLVAVSASAQTPTGSSSTGILEGVTFSSRVLASPAAAAQAAPAAKKYTVLFGVDTPAVYLFRGIRQESVPDLTVQPYLDLGFAVNDKVNVNIGTWNSFHNGTNNEAYDNEFYESDFYASMTFLAGKWKPGVLYTLYMSPAGGYDSIGEDGSIGVNELAVFASYDDSAMKVPMSPKFTVAFELTDTQADFGSKSKGIYIELAAKPAFKLGDKASLYVPLKVGLSGKDYYEFGYAEGSTFGFFDVGLGFGVPLGMGEVHGGLDIYTFGDSLKTYNGKRTNSVASVGFSITK